ncbi:autoinducer binding domain-containing protein [Enterobacter roggenkampii]|nr:autoinducer binding domain-containing protein [Enterobacter roggenkampii]QLP22712.1 autoinducer binding domain-containing protein [Enterobacter roggenkampii]
MKDTYYNDLTINTQIQSELDAFFEDFKGIVFAYAIMNKKDPSQMRIINNSPEWFTIYLEKKYQFIDPVIIRALRCVEDFFWESDVVLSDGYNLTRIFDESVQYDIYQGQTFPLHDYLNNLVVLSVISPKEGANKQVISSQADSLIKISRIWADFFPANTSNQPI